MGDPSFIPSFDSFPVLSDNEPPSNTSRSSERSTAKHKKKHKAKTKKKSAKESSHHHRYAPRATHTVPNDDNSTSTTTYREDRQGDRRNLQFESLDSRDIPAYTRGGDGQVLGLPAGYRVPLHRYTGNTEIPLTDPTAESGIRSKGSRYFQLDAKRANREVETLLISRLVSEGTSHSLDYIPFDIGTRRPKLTKASPFHGDTHATQDPLNYQLECAPAFPIPDHPVAKETENPNDERIVHIQSKIGAIERELQKNPAEPMHWRRLLTLQFHLALAVEGSLHDESLDQPWQLDRCAKLVRHQRALYETQCHVYERALKHLPDQTDLLLDYLDLYATLYPDRIGQRWDQILTDSHHRATPEIWIAYLNYCQTRPSEFTCDAMLNTLARCQRYLLTQRKQGSSDLSTVESYQLYVFLRTCVFLVQAGYSERAVALYQTQLEYILFQGNVAMSASTVSDTNLDGGLPEYTKFLTTLLPNLWVRTSPRLATAPSSPFPSQSLRATLWDALTGSLNVSAGDDSASYSPTPLEAWSDVWISHERQLDAKSFAPVSYADASRSGPTFDPYGVVFPADLSGLLFPVSCPTTYETLSFVWAWLIGAPFRPLGWSSNHPWIADPFLFHGNGIHLADPSCTPDQSTTSGEDIENSRNTSTGESFQGKNTSGINQYQMTPTTTRTSSHFPLYNGPHTLLTHLQLPWTLDPSPSLPWWDWVVQTIGHLAESTLFSRDTPWCVYLVHLFRIRFPARFTAWATAMLTQLVRTNHSVNQSDVPLILALTRHVTCRTSADLARQVYAYLLNCMTSTSNSSGRYHSMFQCSTTALIIQEWCYAELQVADIQCVNSALVVLAGVLPECRKILVDFVIKSSDQTNGSRMANDLLKRNLELGLQRYAAMEVDFNAQWQQSLTSSSNGASTTGGRTQQLQGSRAVSMATVLDQRHHKLLAHYFALKSCHTWLAFYAHRSDILLRLLEEPLQALEITHPDTSEWPSIPCHLFHELMSTLALEVAHRQWQNPSGWATGAQVLTKTGPRLLRWFPSNTRALQLLMAAYTNSMMYRRVFGYFGIHFQPHQSYFTTLFALYLTQMWNSDTENMFKTCGDILSSTFTRETIPHTPQLWLYYLNVLCHIPDTTQNLLPSMASRAVRNCPWSKALHLWVLASPDIPPVVKQDVQTRILRNQIRLRTMNSHY
ncbi:hypothetical protein IWQ62_002665 [Dispira parvispora]|uniref:Uncharacterized protein n=1 Tax=Dispira parvispora TaxID=1520584 RepID=A0A9W8AVL9_9FUNG|nr:hypothetical protein IWQ62_002665 [Dispira parvispora]